MTYISVPVETIAEGPLHKRMEVSSPRCLLGNSPSTSGTINLPVHLSGEEDYPPLSVGLGETLSPTGQAGGSSDPPILYPATYPTVAFQHPHFTPDTIPEGVRNIPGMGGVHRPGFCGTYHTAFACVKDYHHFAQKVPHKCFDLSCPLCYGSALTRAGKRVAKTFRGLRERISRIGMTDNPGYAEHLRRMANNPDHLVGSPPPGRYPEGTPVEKIRKDCIKIAMSLGIEGAPAVFVHEMRIPRPIQNRLSHRVKKADVIGPEGREKKYWALVREDALHIGGIEKYTYYSPHVHMAGAVGYLMPQNTPEEKAEYKRRAQGWVFWKRPGHIDMPPLDDCFTGQEVEDPIAGLVYYIGSHAAYRPGHRLYTAFGLFDSKNIRKDGKPVDDKRQMTCPKCNSPVAFGEEMGDRFEYERGTKGDPWRPRLINLQGQKYLIRGIDVFPKKEPLISTPIPWFGPRGPAITNGRGESLARASGDKYYDYVNGAREKI